jgi:cbb3-type cytochrome oxidase subunit 3
VQQPEDAEHPELPEQYPEQPVDGAHTREIGNRTYVVADVEPLDVDGTRTVAVGSAIFLVAFLVLLPFHDRLRDAGKAWWLWTCLAGFALGVVGWEYCRRRRHRRAAEAS